MDVALIDMAFFRGIEFLRYYSIAQNNNLLHSPFVFDFYNEVLIKNSSGISSIQKEYNHSIKDKSTINIVDLGTNSNINKNRTIAEITKKASRNMSSGLFLYRLIKHYKPQTCLELGTQLGFSGLYQINALKENNISYTFVTIEGSPSLFNISQKRFERNNFRPYQLLGNFDSILPTLTQKFDYIFIDGNHTYQATIHYFEWAKTNNPNAIIVFDDIRWSKEMFKAWNQIIIDVQSTVTIDLFGLGIVFLNRPQAKEHFILKPPIY